ncbi:MAG: mannonate dehydratase [Bacteroidales bacterium]|nr:mannonate dehydratase [Bacteroidales bacterium]
MEKTWRWFGRKDKVSLEMLRQIGVEGIVTALHDEPVGAVWTVEKINEMKAYIESFGLRWSVVESLPVSEQIKYAGPDRDRLIENYKISLANLGKCGIKTICYNFMPVIDWVRTELEHPMPDGTLSLYFDYARFAYFDMKILGRKDAEKDFPADVVAKVEDLDKIIAEEEKQQLIDTIITKTQGFVNGPLGDAAGSPVAKFKELMRPYEGMTKDGLRANMKYFLEAVMPVCDEYDINMCVHPDDPPMPVFGMPRLVCNADDIRWFLGAVDNFHNGLTFCAGSLSAGAHNDVVAMAREFAPRTHFVHMRSCDLLSGGDFVEAPHVGSKVNLVDLVEIFEDTGRNLPMRVDHGKTMLGDEKVGYNPGYTFHGRMLALGQVEGMMAAVRHLKQR